MSGQKDLYSVGIVKGAVLESGMTGDSPVTCSDCNLRMGEESEQHFYFTPCHTTVQSQVWMDHPAQEGAPA